MLKKISYVSSDRLSDVVEDLQCIRDNFPELVVSTVCIRRITEDGRVDMEVLLLPESLQHGAQKLKVGCKIDITI